jgi:hypothetical protein
MGRTEHLAGAIRPFDGKKSPLHSLEQSRDLMLVE